jgi:hypothetical protein
LNSATRTVLLVPCLLVCLACATPFPFERLEEGMTTEAVRERFGAPEAMGLTFGVYPNPPESYWTYVHEERDWTAILFPPLVFGIPINAALPDASWDRNYIKKNSIVLHFEKEKLVHWQVIEPLPGHHSDTNSLRSAMERLECEMRQMERVQRGDPPTPGWQCFP